MRLVLFRGVSVAVVIFFADFPFLAVLLTIHEFVVVVVMNKDNEIEQPIRSKM